MAVTIKTASEIALMREAGRLLGEVHNELAKALHAGMTTKEVDRLGERLIRKRGCIPSFLGYGGFPASICVSVNDEVIHGIPGPRVLKEGDIVSLDAGLIWKGFQSDAARTHIIGEGTPKTRQLVQVTRDSFFAGIKMARAGNHLHDISNAIADFVEPFGFGIVEDYVGHGIGREMHEAPEIPNFRQKSRGIRLRPGMTLAIEPMINMGTWEVRVLSDEWTVVTRDGRPAAHYENTILITEGEPEILSIADGVR
ncbi:MAG: type I methionyl aminopeptidase [Lachnospiraceae bacterium]|nr:type I methionyl aminopeptidase [Lachnospiraceae bacterium]